MAYKDHPRSAIINFSNTGDNTVITGVANRVIKVVGILFTVTTATNVKFADGNASPQTQTVLSGTYDLQANGSLNKDDVNIAQWQCSPGNDFVINQSGTASVQGNVWYLLL